MTPAIESPFQFLGHAIRSFQLVVCELSEEELATVRDAGGWKCDVLLDRSVLPPVVADDEIQLMVDLSVLLRWSPEPGPFTAEALVRGFFSHRKDLPAKDAERLRRVHAPALLYAQLRPLMRMHAAEAGHAQFTLPLINIAETFRAEDASHSENADKSDASSSE